MTWSWWAPPRSQQPEWLDDPAMPATALAANLADLRWLNRVLGCHWLLARALHRLWRQADSPSYLRVLDVGTGAGDVPRLVQRWARRRGIRVTVVGLDLHRGIMQYLRTTQPRTPDLAYVQADGLSLPFPPQTFDIVLCATMLHHLDWAQSVALLRSMATVARLGVVVTDLLRSWLHYYAARLVLAATGCHAVTRHDGALSVRRAYRVAEVRALAQAAGIASAQISTLLGYRFLLHCAPVVSHA